MTATDERRPQPGLAQRPFRRSRGDAILGGVCAGLATRFGFRPQTVRFAVAVATVAFGGGLVLYTLAWLLAPRQGETQSIAQRVLRTRGSAQSLVASGGVLLVVLFVLNLLALHVVGALTYTVFVVALGAFGVWRGATPDERRHLQGVLNAAPVVGAASARGWRAVATRVVPGVIFVMIGLRVLTRIGGVWGGAVPAFVGGAVLIVGVAILLAPWWLENVRDLSHERRARIRSEERATLAAHIHDSVLQTLTLIERAAGDDAEVIRLARSQERALRDWLFAPEESTQRPTNGQTFQQQLRLVQSDVEQDYRILVELVVVGDCAADDDVLALIGAGREATVNAAKWSGVGSVALYGEVEPTQISLYVRDTGVGFDPTNVDARRQGITHSIHQRVEQRGGSAVIHSRPGHGTEVRLSIPRKRSNS
ncbi:MAG TPA: PspC domain-containing protein [Acidimicrobiales bacterium]|nr:PspC domain-containing protein [Acidimicrobiales bacterium]